MIITIIILLLLLMNSCLRNMKILTFHWNINTDASFCLIIQLVTS